MKRNVGETDSWVRLFSAAALVVIVFAFMKSLPVAVIIFAYTIAIILVMTSTTGICPLYSLFGFNTCSKEEREA